MKAEPGEGLIGLCVCILSVTYVQPFLLSWMQFRNRRADRRSLTLCVDLTENSCFVPISVSFKAYEQGTRKTPTKRIKLNSFKLNF